MARVAIVHPWLPQYRLEFFEQLVAQATSRDVLVDIFYGHAPPEWQERGDTVSAEFARELETRFFTIGGKSIVRKSLKPLKSGDKYDLVVAEQAVRNLETYPLLLTRRAQPIAFWGHGRSYTLDALAIQERFKKWVTRQGSWFFAYTQGGADAVIGSGFDPARVTVVRNSIDTRGLRRHLGSITSEERDYFKRTHGLTGKVALYIGGLDEPKRIPFLLEAAECAHDLDPDFRLLIVGAGSDRNLVLRTAEMREYIVYIGPQFGRDKAVSFSAAQVLAIPGRVGLVAVDSFAAGTPIVTTSWKYHAPEFEYLSDGYNAVVTPDRSDKYAQALVSLLQDEVGLSLLSRNARESAAEYSIESMVANFLGGLERAIGAPREKARG